MDALLLEKLSRLPTLLIPWFESNHRDLPWRKTSDPYAIWVSEIMLQQTRVDTVIERYQQFLNTLPTIEKLANCDEEVLYKLWEGLGYYSRVTNMKKAAICICEDFQGRFPDSYEQILQLPGIGSYTAGAILSIAFGKPYPAVDGNVLRVLSRYLPSSEPINKQQTKKLFENALFNTYPKENTSSYTQSLMELGATVCLPNGEPRCSTCPLQASCHAALHACWDSLPVNEKKTIKREEKKTVFLIRYNQKIAVQKRDSYGLLANLWQFPNAEGWLSVEEIAAHFSTSPESVHLAKHTYTHVFSHVTWKMHVAVIEIDSPMSEYTFVTKVELTEQYALPTAFRQLIPIAYE